ncbi:hypothetical protein J6590_014099 [Homalodisca vitripennis]|nr:hypothetical protein J6590_014099 [Homalodisca vitripennis]
MSQPLKGIGINQNGYQGTALFDDSPVSAMLSNCGTPFRGLPYRQSQEHVNSWQNMCKTPLGDLCMKGWGIGHPSPLPPHPSSRPQYSVLTGPERTTVFLIQPSRTSLTALIVSSL